MTGDLAGEDELFVATVEAQRDVGDAADRVRERESVGVDVDAAQSEAVADEELDGVRIGTRARPM